MIDKVLNKFAISNIGTRLYKWSATESGTRFLAEKLPGFETLAASSCYIGSTYIQYKKGNIDKRRHDLLQFQNVLSGVFGYTVGSWACKKASNYINNTVIPNIKPELVPDVHKVKAGIQMALPLVLTALFVRGIAPALIAWGSGKWEQYKAEKRGLDLKA